MRDWLKKLRTDRSVTQKEISQSFGISIQRYSMLENARRHADLPLSMVTKISDYFGVSVEEIIDMELNSGQAPLLQDSAEAPEENLEPDTNS